MTEMTENEMKNLKNEMINFLAEENQGFFKSQQIDDDELTVNDRKNILNEILLKSHLTFLTRFGKYLKKEHIFYFEQEKSLNDDYCIHQYLNELKSGQITKRIKNRRYEAMKKLIKDGSYFGEVEMMNREPFLYELLVGQYLTVTERLARDWLQDDPPFSEVLMSRIEKDQTEELRKKQESELEIEDEDTQEAVQFNENSDDQFPTIPASFKQKWGEFTDVETPTNVPSKILPDYILTSEKDKLRSEFEGIMRSNFLSGRDKDFDYKSVDENSEYDNLKQINQDEEDKYFDSEKEELVTELQPNLPSPDQYEDDLEVFMRTLNAQLSK